MESYAVPLPTQCPERATAHLGRRTSSQTAPCWYSREESHNKATREESREDLMQDSENVETMNTLRARVQRLEADNAAMRAIVVRMAEARMCRDAVTMIESWPHCALKRGGEYGYSGKHDENCVVSQARRLGF